MISTYCHTLSLHDALPISDPRDHGEKQHQAPVDLPDLLAQRHFRVAGGNEDIRRHHVRSAICGVATIGSDRRPEGSRRWVSSRMSRAIGAATAEPPPPCSTTTAQA